jgi:hypothetical protein
MEEIKVRPAKHLALQHFEAIDMAFNRSIGPRQRHASFDGCLVVPEPCRKALQGFQRTGRRTLEPGIKRGGLALADEGGKILGQDDGLGDLGRRRAERRELLGLSLRTLCFTPPHQPGRPARREREGGGLGHDGERLA